MAKWAAGFAVSSATAQTSPATIFQRTSLSTGALDVLYLMKEMLLKFGSTNPVFEIHGLYILLTIAATFLKRH